VTDFLVARYGDFILYRPPLQPSTWTLWGAPFVLLGVGAIVVVRIVRSRARQSLAGDDTA
jgi:cytochrome c-type biogenesis protein CcmH